MKSKEKTLIKERFHSASPPLRFLFPLIIFFYAFILYSNTLNHGFVMDDGAVITDNITVQKGFAGINELFHQSSVYGSTKENFGTYRPLTMTLFAVEWQLFGNNPSRFHLVHILLYALCCTILFLTLKNLFNAYHPLLPLVATLLFVAHPLHTEVAANIKSMDEILSLMFCMAALYFASDAIKSYYSFALSVLCFTAALFSKENSITFLLVIPLSLWLFSPAFQTEKRTGNKKLLILSLVYLSSAALYLLIRSQVLAKAPESMNIINNSLAGASSVTEKFATIFYILFYYIRLLIFPQPLSWDYSYNQIPLVAFSNIFSIISVLFHFGIFAFAVWRLSKFSKINTSLSKLVAFCILFYLITLSVSSNIFVLIAATMAERFLFIPSVAFCLLLAATLLKLTKFPERKNKNIAVSILAVVPILLLYSTATWSRNKDWKSNYALFTTGVNTSPESYRTNSSFAWENIKLAQNEPNAEKAKVYFSLAQTHYLKAVSIYDKEVNDWYNLGVADYNLGDSAAAMDAYRQAITVKPKHRNASYNLATMYFSKKNYPEALKYFQYAYDTDSTFADAIFKVGVNHHMLGNIKEAIASFEKSIVLTPDNKDAITNLSIEYAIIGDTAKAHYYNERLKQLK